jgi:hypothetical protein
VSDSARTEAVLGAAKIRCGEEPALVLSVDDRPGALAAIASRLAVAKINIKGAHASTAGGACPDRHRGCQSRQGRAGARMSRP